MLNHRGSHFPSFLCLTAQAMHTRRHIEEHLQSLLIRRHGIQFWQGKNHLLKVNARPETTWLRKEDKEANYNLKALLPSTL